MNINSIKTKDRFHNFIRIKQLDNTSPIEVLLCDSTGALLSGLNEQCTVSIYDAVSREVRQVSDERIVGGILSFKIVNELLPCTHKLEVTTFSGVKFPADDDFQIFVSESHNSKLINVIKSIPTELALKVVTQQVMDRFDGIRNNFNYYIKKGEVTIGDININLGKIGLAHLSDEVIKAIAGTAPVNAVPANGSITTVKLADKAVDPAKTSFMVKSKNLFDGNYIKGSMRLSGDTIQVSNLQTLTGSIVIMPIEPNTTYTVKIHDVENSDVLRVGVHNSEIPQNTGWFNMDRFVYQNLIRKQTTFTNDENGKVMAVQVSTSGQKPRLQIEKSDYETDYVPRYVLNNEYIVLNNTEESEKELDYTTDIFKNSFKRKSQGTEKTQITNLINDNLLINSNISTSKGEGRKGGFEHSIKMDIETGQTAYIERNIPVSERIEHVHTVGISIRQDILNDDDIITMNLIGENDSVTVPFSKKDLALDGLGRKAGWDILRVRFDYANNASKNIGKIKTARLNYMAKEKTTIYIDNIWAESFEKAKIIFIHDGGYQAFFNKGQAGYYDLEKRGIPMTLASIPAKIYDESNTRFISGEFLKELSLKNNNEISIHSWDGEDSIATKSESEMYEESLKAISMLRDRGHEVLWRAAFLRNRAPGSAGAKPLFHSFAFSTAYAMTEAVEGFPFVAPYNVRRFQLHQRTNETLDMWFDKLKNSRGVWVVYTHNVSNENTGDITPESWTYFLQKLDAALSEGWLEGATFKSLMSAYL